MKWLADECFDNDVVRGLLRRSPSLDVIRAQDVAVIAGRDDEQLMAWANENERIVVTHDLATMIPALPTPARVRVHADCPCARFAANWNGDRGRAAARPVLSRKTGHRV